MAVPDGGRYVATVDPVQVAHGHSWEWDLSKISCLSAATVLHLQWAMFFFSNGILTMYTVYCKQLTDLPHFAPPLMLIGICPELPISVATVTYSHTFFFLLQFPWCYKQRLTQKRRKSLKGSVHLTAESDSAMCITPPSHENKVPEKLHGLQTHSGVRLQGVQPSAESSSAVCITPQSQ